MECQASLHLTLVRRRFLTQFSSGLGEGNLGAAQDLRPGRILLAHEEVGHTRTFADQHPKFSDPGVWEEDTRSDGHTFEDFCLAGHFTQTLEFTRDNSSMTPGTGLKVKQISGEGRLYCGDTRRMPCRAHHLISEEWLLFTPIGTPNTHFRTTLADGGHHLPYNPSVTIGEAQRRSFRLHRSAQLR